MIKNVSSAEFNEIRGNGVVLVDFYSKTCGPCKMLAFILADVDKEVGDDVTIAKLDFDENADVVEEFGVKGYPTLVLLRDGVEVARSAGLRQKPEIVNMIKEATA